MPRGEAVGLERCVGVGVEVPLAPPVGVVAELAQQRAPGGEAGIQTAVAGNQAAGLVGVEPGEQRAARGGAVVGGGVVAFEAHRTRAQRRQVGGEQVGSAAAGIHTGVRSWSTRITRMFGGLPARGRDPRRPEALVRRAPGAAAGAERKRAGGEQPLLEEGAAIAGACVLDVGRVGGRHLEPEQRAPVRVRCARRFYRRKRRRTRAAPHSRAVRPGRAS